MRLLVLTLLTAGALSSPALAVPPGEDLPLYELRVRDADVARRIATSNEWFGDFSRSNLYRGAMLRLGPALYAVGEAGKDPFTGRLLDVLAERVLARHGVSLAYFQRPGLSSPFGVTVTDLGKADLESVRLLVKALRSAPNVVVGSTDTPVAPVKVRRQRFAVAEGAGCLAVARDPWVAGALARRCGTRPRLARETAATLTVSTGQFFSAWSALLENRFGTGGVLEIAFSFDAKTARLVPRSATLPLQEGHAVLSGPLDEALLGAIPANALFVSTVFLPTPAGYDAENVAAYLGTVAEEPPAVAAMPVTLLFLGMEEPFPGVRSRAMTALLLPKPASEAGLADLEALFDHSRRFPVQVLTVGAYVAISPSARALERIGAAAAGTEPSLRQAPRDLVSPLQRKPVSAAAYLDLGAFFRTALLHGRELDAHAQGIGLTNPPPPEVADSLSLLDRLPVYAFHGRAEARKGAGSRLVLEAVSR